MEDNKQQTATGRSYIVYIPGTSRGEQWDEAKWERNKDKLMADHKDAQVVELSPLGQGEDIAEGDTYSVYIPGTSAPQQWDGAKLSRNRERLYADHPNVAVNRLSAVNYYGDKLNDINTEIERLESDVDSASHDAAEQVRDADLHTKRTFGVPEQAYAVGTSLESQSAQEPVRKLRARLDELYRLREDNPEYQRQKTALTDYLKGQEEAVQGEIDKLNADAKTRQHNVTRTALNPFAAADDKDDPTLRDDAALRSAKLWYNDALKTAKAPSRYGKETGFANFLRGLIGEAPETLTPVALSKSIAKNSPVISAIKDIHNKEGEHANIASLVMDTPEKLDYLSPAQMTALRAFVTKSYVDASRAKDLSLGYQAGQSAMQSVGFMLDFYGAGGLGDAAAKGATKALTRSIAKVSSRAGLKGLGREAALAAPKFAAGTLQSAVKSLSMSPFMPSTYANMLDNMTAINDAGEVDLSGDAILQSVGDALIENLSESAGVQVEAILGAPLGVIGKSGLGRRIATTPFGKWGQAIKSSPAAKILKQAGWNGFIGEIGEEWYGNAVRVMTGVDKDALKNFATVDQQIITIASFAPMSILGGATSAVQYKASKIQMDNAAKHLEDVLHRNGYDDQTIRNYLDVTKAETPAELGERLTPAIVQAVADNADAPSVYRAVMDYASAVARWRTFDGISASDISEQRQQAKDAITASMGGEREDNKWIRETLHQLPDESGIVERGVRMLTDANGVDYFVQAEGDDGSFAAVDRQGMKHIISREQLNNMLDTGDLPLNDFLDRELVRIKAVREQDRMQADKQANRQALLKEAYNGREINIGTADNPQKGTVRQYTNGKFVVQTADGSAIEYTESQMAAALNMPLDAQTDEQIEDAAANEFARQRDLQKRANEAGKSKNISSLVGEEGVTLLEISDPQTDPETGITTYPAFVRRASDGVAGLAMLTEEQVAAIAGLGQQAQDSEEEQVRVQSNGQGTQANPTTAPTEAAAVNGGVQIQQDTQNTAGGSSSALSRIPVDERGNPLYEQADADTAWDAIVEQTSGDEDMAKRVASSMLEDKKATLQKAEKSKVKSGTSIADKIAAEKAHQDAVDKAKSDVAAWQSIVLTPERRRSKAAAQRREQLARQKAEEQKAETEAADKARKERESLNGVPDMVDDKPADARARGYRNVNGYKVDRQTSVDAIKGKEVAVKFSDKATQEGHIAIIDAGMLQPSHIGGVRNPAHFLDEAQPKERNDKASIAAAEKIAANIRPEEITSSVTAYVGAPAVNARGEVIQGNNRSAALRLMWERYPDQAVIYKQYLKDHAVEFGLKPEDINGVEHPVLVNMLDVTDERAITLGQFVAQDTESGGAERIKPKNVAQKMGADMRTFADMLLASTDDDTSLMGLVDINGAETLKWMAAYHYITDTQYASAFNGRGELTDEAKNDLRGILFQSIFRGGSTRLEEMFNTLPAKAQRAILATAFRDFDSQESERMMGEIQDSITAFHSLMQDKDFAAATNYEDAAKAARTWAGQTQWDFASGEAFLPSDNFSNFAVALAVMYKGRTQKFLQGKFNEIFDLVQGVSRADLFNTEPDTRPRTLKEAIKEALNIDYNGKIRSNAVAVGSESGQERKRGGHGNAAGGEQDSQGERTPERGGGAAGVRENAEVGADTSSGQGEVGPFGKIFRQFKGKAEEAIAALKAEKGGEAVAALHHPDIGNIDLIWGEEGTGHSDGFGLAKIVKFHPEVADNLQEILLDMSITSRSDNRVQLESKKYKATVRLSWDEQQKTWLLTAFEKKNSVPDNTTDTDEASNRSERNDTTTPQNTVSDGKNSEISGELNTPTGNPTAAVVADAYKKKTVSGGSSDIVPESSKEDKQNGTAPLQNTSIRGKVTEKTNNNQTIKDLQAEIGRLESLKNNKAVDPKAVQAEINRLEAELTRIQRHEVEQESGTGFDKQGNPLNEDGTLRVEKINSIDELTDEDFTNPARSVELPNLSEKVDAAIGAEGKPVIIKKNIFEKNRKSHPDISAEQNREILRSALYTPNLYGQNQKTARPYNWVLIKVNDGNTGSKLVLLEVNHNKDNVEVVNWHYLRSQSLETIKRQAVREGDPLLILPSSEEEEAGGLSGRTQDLSSTDKDSEKAGKSNDGRIKTDAPLPEYGSQNKIITTKRYEELKRRMKEKLGQLNAGFDPELFSIGAQMAAYHIEAGARKFSDYARRMIADLSDAIRPYLKSFYNGARDFPGMEAYKAEMDPAADVDAIDINAINVADEAQEQEKPSARQEIDTNGLFGAVSDLAKGKSTEVKISDFAKKQDSSASTEKRPDNDSKINTPLTSREVRTIGEIGKYTHTKTGKVMTIVRLTGSRLSSDEFKKLKARAKELGGYYSSFGSAKGFLFDDEEDAVKFNTIEDTSRNGNEITDEQTGADTAALVGEAGLIAEKAQSLAEDEGAVDEGKANEAIDAIDEHLDKVNGQLAILGYYNADTLGKSSFNESYGYRKSAEKKAVADVDKLAKRLAADLGLEVGRKRLAKANIAPAGGEVSFRLPLKDGYELYMSISLVPNDYTSEFYGDDLIARGVLGMQGELAIYFRVENPKAGGMDRYVTGNNFQPYNVTYATLLKEVRRDARDYLPEQPKAYEGGPIDIVQVAKEQAEKSRKSKEKAISSQREVNEALGDLFATLNGAETSEESTAEEDTEGVDETPASPTEVNGFRKGDRVLYTPSGKGQPKEAIIYDFNYDGRPILDAGLAPIAYDVTDWDNVKPLNTKQNEQQLERDSSRVGTEGQLGSDRLGGGEAQAERGVGESAREESRGTDAGGAGEGELHSGTGRPLRRVQGLESKRNTRNNRVSRGEAVYPKTETARYKANIAAIRLLKELQDSGKQATKEQMAVLRRFTGWGGLGGYFNNTYSNEYHELRSLLTDEEMRAAELSINTAYYTPVEIIDAMWDIAKQMGFSGGKVLEGSAGIGNILASMPKSMSEASEITAVELDGISGGILRLLYPDANVMVTGFQDADIDNSSVDLAITNVPFSNSIDILDTKEKDLTRKFGHRLHDFCIAKNLRKLKEGGIGIFITTRGTLDSQESKKLREWVTREGDSDFIGAFRLNNKTFSGTGATSDIIVIRRRVNGQVSPEAIDLSRTSITRREKYGTGKFEWNKETFEYEETKADAVMEVNDWFIEHPEDMGGEMLFGFDKKDTFRPGSAALYPKYGIDQLKRLSEWAKTLKNSAEDARVESSHVGTSATDASAEESSATKEGQLVANSKGEICISRRGKAVPLGVNAQRIRGYTKAEVLENYNTLKSAINEALDYQLRNDSDESLKPLLDKLNMAYDTFTKRYGPLHKNRSLAFLRNDVDYAATAAIEDYEEDKTIEGKVNVSVKKTDIFSKRILGVQRIPTPKDVRDGVITSFNQFGRIDIPFIAKALGRGMDSVRDEVLSMGMGFENPESGNVEVSFKYLSGNVREKLDYAKAHNAKGRYDENIKALEKVVPLDIPAHLIEFTLGSDWLEPQLYTDYAKEKFGLNDKFQPRCIGGAWKMPLKDWEIEANNEKNRQAGVTSESLGTTKYGHELMLNAMNNTPVVFTRSYKDGDGEHTETDKIATQAAEAKIAEMRDDFREWCRAKMLQEPDLAQRIQRVYNDTFNSIVPMEIDDTFAPEHFEGQVLEMDGKPFNLYPHQAKAIIRATMQPLMMAHEVGTGKTYSLIATAMEYRRLGMAKKPMIVVQNSTVGQFVSSAKELYPQAKILTMTESDRTQEGRAAFYAKIKYNDWDMIIIPQSVFDMIPDSEERKRAFIQEKIDEKIFVINQAKESGNESSLRDLKNELEDLEYERDHNGEKRSKKGKRNPKKEAEAEENAASKARKQLSRKTDDVTDFDDMGIDALLVDEAHMYKHLGFSTSMKRGIKGVDSSYSERSAGLYLKVRAIFDKVGWRNVVFATGTPISNTAAEIWTFMKYLMPADEMRKNHIYYFDDFVRNFGRIEQTLEFATNGKFKEQNRFSAYTNLPELIRIWSVVTDTRLTKDAIAARKADGEIEKLADKIPVMQDWTDENGVIHKNQARDIFLSQSPSLRRIMTAVRKALEEYEKMSGKEKRQHSQIPLTMYGIAARAAIDPRLVDSEAVDEPISKTNEAVREILKDLKDTEKYKGTTAVFSDVYRRKDITEDGEKVEAFNLFDEIKRKLVEAGVPSNKIVIIKSGMSVDAKERVFARVNSGDVRVIMGTTAGLGTGVNIQERLYSEYHLDAPNRPMDYTQRTGRILRQGNLHKKWGIPVKIVRFGVKDSLDVTAYQRLATKSKFINSVMDYKPLLANVMELRVLEEDEEGLFDNPVAVLSGSQFAMLKAAAERELRKLKSKKEQYEQDQIYIERKLKDNKRDIERQKNAIELEKKRLAKAREIFPKGEVSNLTIDGIKVNGEDRIATVLKERITGPIRDFVTKNRDSYSFNEKRFDYSLTFNGVPVTLTANVRRDDEWDETARKFVHTTKTQISYSCPEFGIDARRAGGGINGVKDLIQRFVSETASGKEFEEAIANYSSSIRRMESDDEVMLKRRGNPFADEEKLKHQEEIVKDYTEKMKEEMKEKEKEYASMAEENTSSFNLDNAVEALDDTETDDDEATHYRRADNTAPSVTLDTTNPIVAAQAIAAVNRLAKKLGLRVVYDSELESKGAYTEGTDYVRINLANCESVDDAVETLLHEGVAHFGLREMLGEDGMKEFISDILAKASPSIRAKIEQMSQENGWDMEYAAEEYVAELAQKTDYTRAEHSFWREVLQAIRNLISRITGHETYITDDTIREMLVASYENLEVRTSTVEREREDESGGEGVTHYRVRTKPAPEKTAIGYKVFYRGRDGKLYPPMVANPAGEATPVGVWLDADAAPVAGQSKTGRPQVKAGGKGTQGGSGTLAYRPGWHLGEIPYALQFNRVNPATGRKELFPRDFVWAEVEYAADKDYQQEAEAEGMTEGGKYRHSYAGLKRVPEDGFYRYRTNPNPETDPWIITGAMKVNRVLSHEEVDELVRAAGREPQKVEGEDVRFRTSNLEDIDELNARFNEELQEQIDGTQEKGHVYQLGTPGSILRSTGFPDAPIELSASHLAEKASAAHHPFDVSEMKGLVKALQSPIAIFAYGDKAKAQNAIVGINHDGKNFVVGVHFNQRRGNVEVSSIRGLYPKDNAEWLNWIIQGKALYIDKIKIQTLIDQQRRTLADVEYLDLDPVTKVIKDFENPNLIRFRFIGEKGAGRVDAVSPLEAKMVQVEVPRKGLKKLFGKPELQTVEKAISRLDYLNTARQMERARKSARDIKIATGWEKGADGKWRYEEGDVSVSQEVFDHVMAMQDRDEGNRSSKSDTKELKGFALPLSEVLKHDDSYDKLIAEYPKIGEITVSFYNDNLYDFFNSTRGYYDSTRKRLMLNAKEMFLGPKVTMSDFNSVIVHELQHIIQSEEGFAGGGNTSVVDSYGNITDLKQRAKEAEQRAESIKNNDPEWRRLNEELNHAWDWSDEYKAYRQKCELYQQARDKYFDEFSSLIKQGKTKDAFNLQLPEAIDEFKGKFYKSTYDEREKLREALSDREEEIKRDKLSGLQSALDEGRDARIELNNERYQLYQAIAGEVEARNVQNRREMSEDERKGSLAESTEDVLRAQQIILNDEAIKSEYKMHHGSTADFNAFDIEHVGEGKGMHIVGHERFRIEDDGAAVPIQREATGEGNKRDHLTAQSSSILYLQSTAEKEAAVRDAAMKCGVEIELKPALEMTFNGKPLAGYWKDGKMYVCIEHCRDANDAVRTVLHEAVGHNGLRKLIGNDNMHAFCRDVYQGLPVEVRRQIARKAVVQYGGNLAEATEEYLAEQAEIMDFEDGDYERNFWDTVREALRKVLAKIGINIHLTQRDVRWLMWQSYNANKQGDILNEVKRQVVAHKLGFSLTQRVYESDGVQAVRFRHAIDEQSLNDAQLYDRAVNNVSGRLKESFVDMYQSVDEGIKQMEKSSGKKASEFEDPRLALNQQSSKALAALDNWDRYYNLPMKKAMLSLMQAMGGRIEDVERYVMLKHGLERNKLFAKRDALARHEKEHEDKLRRIARATSISKEDKKELIEAENARYERKKADVEAGRDSVYLKLRKRDYSGLSSFYSEYPANMKQKKGETDEEYAARLYASRMPIAEFADENGNADLALMEQAAQKEIEAIESAHKVQTDELWKRINAATKKTLKEQYDANVLSHAQYEELRDMFEYYVPLRGFADKTAEDFYDYYRNGGHGAFIPPVQKAKGRSSKAASPFGYIAAAESNAIAQNVKNEAKLTLYYFISNRPHSDIMTASETWFEKVGTDDEGHSIFRAVYPEFEDDLSRDEAKQAFEKWEKNMQEKAAAGLAYKGRNKVRIAGGVIRTVGKTSLSHVIPFKLAGRDVMILVNANPRIAQAFNGELNYNAETNPVTRWLQGAMRLMSSLNTEMNPEFWISNLQRDLLFAMMSVNIKESKEYQREYQKNLSDSFKNIVRLKKSYDNGTIGDSRLERLYKSFVDNGGVTGYTVIHDNAFWERQLRVFAGEEKDHLAAARKAIRAVSDFGEAIEQIGRFASFVTSVEQGKDIRRAVADAKELTVNFNRKGSGKGIKPEEARRLTWGKGGRRLTAAEAFIVSAISYMAPYGRRAIMFFNASIQGLNATVKLFGQNSPKALAWSGVYLLLGAAQAALHAMLDGDDDDDKDGYLDIPDWERRNNALVGFNGVYFKWALPQEMRAFYGLGDMVVNHALGREPNKNIVPEFLSSVLDVSPVNPAEGVRAFAPAALVPAIDIWTNEDYKGAKVHNEHRYYDEEQQRNVPKWRDPLRNTSDVSIALTKILSAMTGGDDYKAGWLNADPNNLEHLWEGYTGGLGTTAEKTIHFVENAFEGEFRVKDTPFLRRMLVIGDERYRNSHTSDLFYYYRDIAQRQSRMIKEAILKGDSDKVKELTSGKDYDIMNIYNSYDGQMKYYDDAIRDADDDERKELMEEQDALRKEMIQDISDLD